MVSVYVIFVVTKEKFYVTCIPTHSELNEIVNVKMQH